MKFYRTNEQSKDKGISLLIYGPSGIGKTYCVGTLPEGSSLFVDTDKGNETLISKNHCAVGDIEGVEDLQKLYEALYYKRKGFEGFKNIIIDSVSELEKDLQQKRKEKKNKAFMSMKEYAESAEQIREYIRKFRKLVFKGYNVFFTCLEMQKERIVDGEVIHTRSVPQTSKRFYEELCSLFDGVALIQANRQGQRILNFTTSNDFMSKTRFQGIKGQETSDLQVLITKIEEGRKVKAQSEPNKEEGKKEEKREPQGKTMTEIAKGEKKTEALTPATKKELIDKLIELHDPKRNFETLEPLSDEVQDTIMACTDGGFSSCKTLFSANSESIVRDVIRLVNNKIHKERIKNSEK